MDPVRSKRNILGLDDDLNERRSGSYMEGGLRGGFHIWREEEGEWVFISGGTRRRERGFSYLEVGGRRRERGLPSKRNPSLSFQPCREPTDNARILENIQT